MSRVFAVVGPSGAGKDTLMRAAAAQPGVAMVRRVITRPADAGDEDSDAATPAEFAALSRAGAFALEWQAHGLSYGIPRILPRAEVVLINLSRRVLAQAAAVFPGLHVLHVTATPQVRAHRLAARGREDADDIALRLERDVPLTHGGAETTLIDNSGPLEQAVAAFLGAIGRTS